MPITKTKNGNTTANFGFKTRRYSVPHVNYVLANELFNGSGWRGEFLEDDKRWVCGVPPVAYGKFPRMPRYLSQEARRS